MKKAAVCHTLAALSTSGNQDAVELVQQSGITVHMAPEKNILRAIIENSDIVHVHYWNTPEMLDFLCSTLPPRRLLVEIHIGGEHPPHVITRELINFADIVKTTGPFSYDLPIFSMLKPEERLSKIHMIYCAADFSRLKGFTPRKHDAFNVTYLGTVAFIKMHPDFIKLCHSIRIPESNFIVCGFGQAYPELKQQAQKLGILHRFEFRGEEKDIRHLLEITDVLGYPLCHDNFSSGELILQEAAYAGIPAVVFPYGGAGRMVINDFTGYVVHSEAEYREAIEFLHKRPGERQRLGQNAREYARQLFGQPLKAAGRVLHLYQKMMIRPKNNRNYGNCPASISQAATSPNTNPK
ncbi:MAG: glycosyltransferase family 4 protein [Desulfamplus sp.]|nr:glycosyltransferase family 4 protein [Desulfamplus sp.]